MTDEALLEAVKRAETGLIDADLGGGVIKQRIPRPNEGRSGGYRAILIVAASEVYLFVHLLAKTDRQNFSAGELMDARDFASLVTSLSESELALYLQSAAVREVPPQ